MPQVKLLGGLRSKVGAEAIDLEVDTVQDLLQALIERGGDDLAVLFYDDPSADPLEPHRDLRVLVNGRSIAFLAGLDTALERKDTVAVHLSGARGYPGG